MQALLGGASCLATGVTTATAYYMHKNDPGSFWKKVFSWGARAATGACGIFTYIAGRDFYKDSQFLRTYTQADLQRDLQEVPQGKFTTNEVLLRYRVAFDQQMKTQSHIIEVL